MNMKDCKFQPNPEVVDTVFDKNEAALLDIGTKLTYSLNQTGLRIWYFLKKGFSIDEITDRLHEEFNVEREEAMKGVVDFIQELRSFKLIVPINR